jgi:tetratricopeptide (TPR) repeat protein
MQNPPTREALDQLLRQLPSSSDALLDMVRSLESRGQVAEALELLKAAARVSPDPRFDRMLGTLLMKLGRYKEALVPLIAVLKQHPQHHPTMLMVCESLIECREYERALGMLQQAERAGAPAPHIQNLRLLATQRQDEQAHGGMRRGPLDDPDASLLKSSPLDRLTQSQAMYGQAQRPQPPQREDDRTEAILASSFESTSVLDPAMHARQLSQAMPPGMHDGRTTNLPADVLRAHQQLISQNTHDRTSALPPGMFPSDASQDATQARSAPPGLMDHVRWDAGQARSGAPLPGFGPRPDDPSQSDLLTAHVPSDIATGLLSPDAIPFQQRAAQPPQRPMPPRQPTPMAQPALRRTMDEALESDIQVYRPPQASLFESQIGDDSMIAGPPQPLLGRPNALSSHGAENQYDPMASAEMGLDTRAQLFGRAEDIHGLAGPDLSSSGPQLGWPQQAPRPQAAPQPAPPQQPYHSPSGPPPRQPQAQQAGPRSIADISDNIELAIELPARNAQGTAARPAEPAPRPGDRPSAAIAERVTRGRAARGQRAAPSAAVIGALLGVGAVALMYLVLFIADRGLRQDVQGHLNAASQLQNADTYSADVEALGRLDRAQEATSFLGAGADGFVQHSLPSLPGLSAQHMRKQALVEAAVVAARLEDRYATPGDYKADERVTRAAQAAGEDHAQVLGARSYVLRHQSPLEALALAHKATLTQPGSSYVREAYAEILLSLHQVEAASKATAALREQKLPLARQQYLLARIAAAQGKKEAAIQLRKLLDGLSQQHMDARIALAETMLWSLEDHPRAESLLGEALKATDEVVPPCQKARAQVVMARLRYRQDDAKEAVATMRRAAAICPTRGEAPIALIDFLLDTGAFDEARATMDKQQGAGGAITHELMLRRARLAQMTSRAEEGIEALASSPQEDPRVHWMRGALYMDLGDFERAANAFDSGAERDPMLGALEAWERIARAHKGDTDAAAVEAIDRLAAKSEQSAEVQRAAGMIRMLLAQQERDTTKRQDLLAQAKKRLDNAARRAPDDALVYYELCQLQIMRRNKESARSACLEAEQRGDQYVPGMLYVAQMWLMNGEWGQAEELLKALQEEHPDDFNIGALLVRANVVGGQLAQAQEALDAWLKHPGGKTPRFKLLQGLIAFNGRDFAAAQGYLQQAAQQDPKDAEAAIFLAYARLRNGEQGAQVEDVLKAQLRHPQWDSFAWLALGELRRRQGRFQDAEENLAQAITLLQEGGAPPGLVGEAYLQRALAWQSKYGWSNDKVRTYLDEAMGKGGSGSSELLYVYGIYLLNQKKPRLEEAAEKLEASLASAPRSCETLQALRLTYTRLKRAEDLSRIEGAERSNSCGK